MRNIGSLGKDKPKAPTNAAGCVLNQTCTQSDKIFFSEKIRQLNEQIALDRGKKLEYFNNFLSFFRKE